MKELTSASCALELYKILLQLPPYPRQVTSTAHTVWVHLVHHSSSKHSDQYVLANVVQGTDFTNKFWVSRLNKIVPKTMCPGFLRISVERKYIQFLQDPFSSFFCQMWTNIISSPVDVPLQKVLSFSQIYAIYIWYKIP